MNYGAKFWVTMLLFQLAFGLAVFAMTREYYLNDQHADVAIPTVSSVAPFDWVNRMPETNPALLDSLISESQIGNDPVEISRRADEHFSNKQYAMAAKLYERLLTFDQSNVDVHNNLGLTLHYLGRSTEALRRLDEGIAVDPSYQRIWLTLGFVNSQLGNISDARKSLTTAVEMGSESQVGQSAAKMLEGLPST